MALLKLWLESIVTCTYFFPVCCITNNPEFPLLCKNKVVLKNVLACLNSIKLDGWNVMDPPNRYNYRSQKFLRHFIKIMKFHPESQKLGHKMNYVAHHKMNYVAHIFGSSWPKNV